MRYKVLIALVVILCVSGIAYGAEKSYIFYDSYTDRDYVDLDKTNAYVDTEKVTVFEGGEVDRGVVTLSSNYSNVLDFTGGGVGVRCFRR